MITVGQLIGILSAFPRDHWVMFAAKNDEGPIDFDPHCIQEYANRLIITSPEKEPTYSITGRRILE